STKKAAPPPRAPRAAAAWERSATCSRASGRGRAADGRRHRRAGVEHTKSGQERDDAFCDQRVSGARDMALVEEDLAGAALQRVAQVMHAQRGESRVG